MNTEIKNAIQAADSEAQYDESAKRLLAQKYVLAHILVRTVEEFQGMEIEKVVSLIEGDPYIGKVSVASGLTNKDRNVEGKRIVGLNTEAGEKNEGLVRFDIIFYVRMRNGLAQMIINVEAQKDEPGSYQILNHAIQQKMKIMEQEYHIPMEESFKEEVSIMCNLSQGIKEAGIAEGREAGIAEGREAGIAEGKQREIEKVILNMHKKGYSLEQIMDATDLEAAELETIIEKLK